MKYTFLMLFFLNISASVAHASENLPANPWASGTAVMNVSEEYQSDFYTEFKGKLSDMFSSKQEPQNQIIISVKPYKPRAESEDSTQKTPAQNSSVQNNTGLLSMFDNLRAVGYNIPESESTEMNFTRFLPNDGSLSNNLSYINRIREMVQDFEKNSGLNIHDTLQKIMQ